MFEARGKGGIEADVEADVEVEASRMKRIIKIKNCEIEQESNSLTILIDND